ncbi:hypothetical protein AFL01nite_18460 [Aeromicrobium flavum]|uniref:ASCH domain-containing protein n=1 Tax=Aeromicrobium flavum TaxID=416568 RepID=A0A512HVP8_9ACTN|nr:ASCH domain-containing protein [Aeromicrobium flavum]GEO89519.1 hypothetical protein AFL01nite_18460 [Aeromicrobium flavum]
MTGLPRLWQDFVAAHPEHAGEQPEVEPFGDSVEMAEDLAQLVLAGTKRATAAPVEEGVPPDGAHWVLLDGRDVAVAVLRTTEIRIGRLDSVDDAFAWDEGEGDRTRDWWLDAHRGFFRRRLPHVTDVDALPTVFERFRVVWPPEYAD